MMRIVRTVFLAPRVLLPAFILAACGGGDGPTTPPPPPTGPPPPPAVGASLNLQPGEVQVLTDPAAIRSFQINGGSDAAEYQVIVMSGSQTEGASAPVRFRARASNVSANAVSTAVVEDPSGVTRGPILPARDPRLERRGHLALMQQMEESARRVGAQPSPRFRGGSPGIRASVAANVPAVNDPITLTSGVVPSGGVDCVAATPISGTVRSVGNNFIIVEDDRATGELTAQDFAELEQELDAFVAPVDQDFFGVPNDLDNNGRTIAFFTHEVNRLADTDSGIIILGFHTLIDHLDPAGCPASNEAEIVWLLAPDPSGQHGFNISVDFVKLIARSLVAHEFQHLINASLRVGGQSGPILSLADLWVNEGLSHIGEEVSGLHRIGMGTRQNLGFAEITGDAVSNTAFDDFHNGNLRNMETYLSNPSDLNSLAISNAGLDFATRGWGYVFLRWLADRYAPAGPVGVVPGSGEPALFRELAVGGPQFLFGVDNILRAINVVSGESPTWDEVLAEYFAAPAVDDAGTSGLPSEIQFSTWDYPRLWEEMRSAGVPNLSGGYPLNQRIIQMGAGVSSTNDFELFASTARYFRLTANGAHPDFLFDTTLQSGSDVPSSRRVRIIVVRTQ